MAGGSGSRNQKHPPKAAHGSPEAVLEQRAGRRAATPPPRSASSSAKCARSTGCRTLSRDRQRDAVRFRLCPSRGRREERPPSLQRASEAHEPLGLERVHERRVSLPILLLFERQAPCVGWTIAANDHKPVITRRGHPNRGDALIEKMRRSLGCAPCYLRGASLARVAGCSRALLFAISRQDLSSACWRRALQGGSRRRRVVRRTRGISHPALT
jgi:hypothetical protein